MAPFRHCPGSQLLIFQARNRKLCFKPFLEQFTMKYSTRNNSSMIILIHWFQTTCCRGSIITFFCKIFQHEPFAFQMPETYFNMARYLVHLLQTEELNAISKAYPFQSVSPHTQNRLNHADLLILLFRKKCNQDKLLDWLIAQFWKHPLEKRVCEKRRVLPTLVTFTSR